jgi:thiol-disulfide isomerase/thioredoxin
MDMKKLLILLSITAIVLFSACSVPGTSKTPSKPEPKNLNPASDFQLESLDGDKVKLSELKGKPVVINFLATWCSYCDTELPGFLSAKEEYGDEVTFLFIDVQESVSDVKAYRDKKGYDNYSPLLDSDGSVSKVYGITGFPTTIIVDSDGNITETYRGMIKEDVLKKAVEAVKGAE